MPERSKHTYPLSTKVMLYTILAIFTILILLFTVMWLVATIQVIQQHLPLEHIIAAQLPLFAQIFIIPFLLIFSNMYPTVEVSNSGLYIQIFVFWKKFVAWEEVIDIHSTAHGQVHKKILGRSFSYVVLVQELTPVHYFFGLPFMKAKPGFRIVGRISDFDTLIATIKARTNLSTE